MNSIFENIIESVDSDYENERKKGEKILKHFDKKEPNQKNIKEYLDKHGKYKSNKEFLNDWGKPLTLKIYESTISNIEFK